MAKRKESRSLKSGQIFWSYYRTRLYMYCIRHVGPHQISYYEFGIDAEDKESWLRRRREPRWYVHKRISEGSYYTRGELKRLSKTKRLEILLKFGGDPGILLKKALKEYAESLPGVVKKKMQKLKERQKQDGEELEQFMENL